MVANIFTMVSFDFTMSNYYPENRFRTGAKITQYTVLQIKSLIKWMLAPEELLVTPAAFRA